MKVVQNRWTEYTRFNCIHTITAYFKAYDKRGWHLQCPKHIELSKTQAIIGLKIKNILNLIPFQRQLWLLTCTCINFCHTPNNILLILFKVILYFRCDNETGISFIFCLYMYTPKFKIEHSFFTFCAETEHWADMCDSGILQLRLNYLPYNINNNYMLISPGYWQNMKGM